MNAEPIWTPTPGDTVVWRGMGGTWIVRGWEDDDTVWIHRPDVRMVPAIGRPSPGMADLVGWRDEPEDEELVSVAALRPAVTARLAEKTGAAK